MTQVNSSPASNNRLSNTLLLLASICLLFCGLGGRGLWVAEGRWAVIAKEMLQSGDWFHPTIGGEPYFDKPLLTYWLVLAARLFVGRLDEWALRLPSAISGLAVLLATMSIGRRLWSDRVGSIATWLLLTTYGFLFWSRTGMADMENLAAIMVCTAWYWARRDRQNFTSFLVFYLIAFLGALTKGLTALVVPLLIILPDILAERRWRSLISLPHVLAGALALALYLLPFIYASMTRPDYHTSGLSLVFHENILRYFQPFDHKEPFYVYFGYLPVLFLPWTPLLLAAAIGLPTIWKKLTERTRWLAKALILVFLFFTLSGSRRSYYILPALPLCALWTAIFVGDVQDNRMDTYRRGGVRIQAVLLGIIILLSLSAPLFVPLIEKRIGVSIPWSLRAATLVTGLGALALGLFVMKFTRRREVLPLYGRMVWPLIAVAAVAFGGYFGWQQGLLEDYQTKRPFAQEVNALIAENSPEAILFYKRYDRSALFYLTGSQPVSLLETPEEVGDFVRSGTRGVLFVRGRNVEMLRSSLPEVFEGSPAVAEKDVPLSTRSPNKKWSAWLLPGVAEKVTGTGEAGP